MLTTLDVVLSQLGVMEASGNNDGVPAERFSDGDEVMWCASLQLWANSSSDDERIARNIGEHYAFRSVTALEVGMKARGWWMAPTTLISRLAPNYLVLQQWTTSDAGAPGGRRVTGRHVDIIEKIAGLDLHCIGGNVDNMVKRVVRKYGSSSITGFVRIPPKVRP